jgi:hypothetical protein
MTFSMGIKRGFNYSVVTTSAAVFILIAIKGIRWNFNHKGLVLKAIITNGI